MANSIHPRLVNHPNIVVKDVAASIAHFRELYGAEFVMDVPVQGFSASLVDIGGMVFELFSPPEFLFSARQGPHFLGLEYVVDIDEARAAIAAREIRLLRDYGQVLHTDPADGFGISFEFYDRSFYGPESPIPALTPAEYWRHEHRLSLSGLKAYTVAVPNADAAARFYQSFLSAEHAYEEERPELGARVIGLEVGGSIVEILEPKAAGPLQNQLYRTGQGIRSVIFRTKDIRRAQDYFVERRVAVIPGSAPNRFAVDPKANEGVLFEFSE
ncbi:MAG: VOC family protein [Candidatus Binataceae bacterium]